MPPSTSSVQISVTTISEPSTSSATYNRASPSRTSAPGWRRTSVRYMSAKLKPPRIMNRTSTHCVAAAKLSIESALVEKPAVGIVVRACANDW